MCQAGAPIAGFYWDNAEPYTGPGAASYIPFGVDAWADYRTMYQLLLPTNCVAALGDLAHACALGNFSVPFASSDVFVIEMLTDSVQLSLHSGVPAYNSDTSAYVVAWGRTMTSALHQSVVGKANTTGLGRTGAFAASCFSHTSFYYSKPFIADPAAGGQTANFVAAFADWWYGRGLFSTAYLMDSCCAASDTDVDFNPTCP